MAPRASSFPFTVSFSHVLALRLVNALTIATFFQPDEFFQSLEPAWRVAFGADSGAWLTWEWHYQLRSSLHPMLFALPYMAVDKASTFLSLSTPLRTSLLVAAPVTLQGIIAAIGDWYALKLASSIYGADSLVSRVALLMQLASPWQWFCSTRTFSNSLETTLTVMALAHWPWNLLEAPSNAKGNTKPVVQLTSLRLSLCLAAFAVVLRPTNALIWLPVVSMTLLRIMPRSSSSLSSPAAVIIREGMLCGALIVSLSLVADRVYFGFWTFPPYNWLNFNISKSLAVFYGRNPWHYYLLQGLPLLCTTSLPLVLQALYAPPASAANQASSLRTLAATVYVTVLALSVISHKEVRFIYPLLPTLNVLAAPYAASFFTSSTTPAPKSPKAKTKSKATSIRNKPCLIAALVVNTILAGYLSYFHQSAPLSVLSFLRTDYARVHPRAAGDELFALFLMPCHSTPWRSHLVHTSLNAYALSCEPPLHTAPGSVEREQYRDEADRFYDDPVGFLQGEMFTEYAHADFVRGAVSKPSLINLPRYIVGFEGVEEPVKAFLEGTDMGSGSGMKLKRVWSAWNGLFHEDWRRAGRIVVWDTGVYGDALPEEVL